MPVTFCGGRGGFGGARSAPDNIRIHAMNTKSSASQETRQLNSDNNGSTRNKRKCRIGCNYNEDAVSDSERETPAKKPSEQSIPETNDHGWEAG